MRVELADVISSENKEMSKQAEIELLSFDSKLGQFPVVKKEPFVLTFTNGSLYGRVLAVLRGEGQAHGPSQR